MKNVGLFVVILGVIGGKVSAADQPFQVHCTSSTRLGYSELDVEVNPAKNYLGYAFKQAQWTVGEETVLEGSNQDQMGFSALSKSSVSIQKSELGDLQIVAVGQYYDRATPIGQDVIEVSLQKSATKVLGGYELSAFVLNGVPQLLFPYTPCRLSGAGI